MAKIISEKAAQRQLIRDLASGNCVFLAGAGISVLPPTGLPSGRDLKNMIADGIFKVKELEHFYTVLASSGKYEKVIPEVLFQEVYSIIGNKIFDIYQVLRLPAANSLHYLLADFTGRFSTKIYTTNFDLLIEKAGAIKDHVHHLHGSIDNPEEMTVLIYQVGRGLTAAQQRNFFRETSNKNLYVAGYSGNDKDIIDLVNNSPVSQIFWLMRDLNDSWTRSNIDLVKRKPCFVFEADLQNFFEPVRTKFRIPLKKDKKTSIEKDVKKICRDFNRKITLFERFASLELVFFRIQEYNLSLQVSKAGILPGVSDINYKKLWFLVALTDSIRILGKDYQQGMKYISEGLANPEIRKYPFFKAQLYNIKGLLLLESEKPDCRRALPLFIKSLGILEQCLAKEKDIIARGKIADSLGRVNNNLGLCYQTNKEYSKAIAPYKRSIDHKKKRGDIIGLSTTQVNISLCYLQWGRKLQAATWERKALALIDKYSLFYRKAFLLREKGIHLRNKKGIKLLTKALTIYHDHIPSALFDIELTTNAIAMIKAGK